MKKFRMFGFILGLSLLQDIVIERYFYPPLDMIEALIISIIGAGIITYFFKRWNIDFD